MTEPAALVVADTPRILGSWSVNPSRTAVIYQVASGGVTEIWTVDRTGIPRLVTTAGEEDASGFIDDDSIAIYGRDGLENTLTYAKLDGSSKSEVARSVWDMRVLGRNETEVVVAEAQEDHLVLFAFDTDVEELRELATFDIPPSLGGALVDDHLVIVDPRSCCRGMLSLNIKDGSLAAVPELYGWARYSVLGVAPNGRDVIFSRHGDSVAVYRYNPKSADPASVLVNDVKAGTPMSLEQGYVYVVDDATGQAKHIDPVTGEAFDVPNHGRPPSNIPGLEERNARMRAVLESGNWIVSGFLEDGASYTKAWSFEQAPQDRPPGTPQKSSLLFEYDPRSGELWQVSEPPRIPAEPPAGPETAFPSGGLRVDILDGFIVYSTGYWDIAYTYEYNLYAAPLPSSLSR